MKIANRMQNIASGTRGEVYQEACKLADQGKKVLKLNTGNPAAFGFPMPDSLKKAIQDALNKVAAYSESAGIDEARQAILEYDISKGFVNIDKNDIVLGNGVSELAEMICMAMFEEGDEVLLPSPNYNLWSNSVKLAGASVKFYECFEDKNWMPTAENIESQITEKTKAIVFINPNNPTGALYSDELLCQIADIARKHNLVVFADEIYDRLVMDGAVHTSFAKLAPDVPTVTFNGLSKSHIICGIRCGWLTLSGTKANGESAFGPKVKDFKSELHKALDTLSAVRLCSNTVAQYCIPAALKDPAYTVEMMSPGGMVYERREATINAVNKSRNLKVIKNTGALYCFVQVKPDKCKITNPKQFSIDLVKATGVNVLPSSSFDYAKPNYFRVVMLPQPEVLVEAIEKIDEFCEGYRQE